MNVRMYVNMCVSLCVGLHVCVGYVCMYVDQRITSGVVLKAQSIF